MNAQFCKWFVSFVLFFSMTLVSSSALAKKPAPDPDPDPVNPGAACVDSVSDFPAFTYVEIRYEDEIFISNAAGDCTISMYKTEGGISGIPTHLSYRYYGDSTSGYGIIVWVEYTRDSSDNLLSTELQMLRFTIEDGEVIEPLPITPTPLLQVISGDYDIYAADLSPGGDRVLFRGHNNNNYYIDEIRIDCTTDCRTRLFETQPDINGDEISIHRPLYSVDGERIYFELDSPDRKLVFIEKDEYGNWPQLDYSTSTDGTTTTNPVLILAHEDGSLGAGGIGYWDYDGDGFAQEVIAHPRSYLGYHTIEILDVDACLATNPPGGNDCVVIGSRSAGGIVIAGRSPSFTSFTDDPPDLLYTFQASKTSGVALRELDLDDFSERTLIKEIKGRNSPFIGGVDAAD